MPVTLASFRGARELGTRERQRTKKYVVHLFTLILLVAAVAAFLRRSESLNRTEIWFSNVDQDAYILSDTLRVNAGREPTLIEHPGLGSYLLYGAGLNVSKAVGEVDVQDIDELFAAGDPILYLPDLYYGMRHLSQVFTLFTAVALGSCVFVLSRSFFGATIAGSIALGSYGVLFQSLMVRTELASVVFLTIAMVCLCALIKATSAWRTSLLCLSAGLATGLAVYSKVAVMPLLSAALLFVGTISIATKTSRSASGPFEHSAPSRMIMAMVAFLGYFFFVNLDAGMSSGPLATALVAAAGVLCLINLIDSRTVLSAALLPGAALIAGFLFATPVVFYLCNVHSPEIERALIANVFSLKLFSQYAVSYHPSLFSDAFMRFLDYSCFRSGLLLAIPVGLLFADKEGRLGAILLTCCGLGMSLVMSARYFSQQYLVYPDLFYSAALGVCFARRNPKNLFMRHLVGSREFIAGGAVAILILVFSVKQYEYAKKHYPRYNVGYRNQLKFVPSGFGSTEFTNLMLEHYSLNETMWRVIRDQRLNGSERSIRIRDIENVNDSLRTMGTLDDPRGR
jgi:hypothetical protein